MKNALPNQHRISAVRRFNRFYTRQIGVLRRTYLGSPYSLAEMRVLYEIANGARTASDIGRMLDLDAGYLSRVLRNFEKAGLISRKPAPDDARQSHLAMTAKGTKTFAPYEKRSQDGVARMLAILNPADQTKLTQAMATIEQLLGEETKAQPSVILRAPTVSSAAISKMGSVSWIWLTLEPSRTASRACRTKGRPLSLRP